MSNQPPPPPPPPPRLPPPDFSYSYQPQYPPSAYRQPVYSVGQPVAAYQYGNQHHASSLCPPPPPPPPVAAAPNSFHPPPAYGYNYNAYSTNINNGNPFTPNPPPYSLKRGENTSLNDSFQQQQEKRRRTNNENTPEKKQWKCDICKVSMDSESALKAHCDAHIKCAKCDFTASRKLVNAHFSSVHGKFSGGGFKSVSIAVPGCRVQRFRICVGNSPDDIKKWIQERKKKFPRKVKKEKDNDGVTEKETEALSSLLDGYGSSSSDEDSSKRPVTENRLENEMLITPDCVDRPPTAETVKHDDAGTSPAGIFRTRVCRYFMRNGTCRNGDKCTFSHTIPEGISQGQHRNKNRQLTKRKNNSQTSLLKKLLGNDIHRESMLTLQLLRYIIDCNYLQPQRKEQAVLQLNTS